MSAEEEIAAFEALIKADQFKTKTDTPKQTAEVLEFQKSRARTPASAEIINDREYCRISRAGPLPSTCRSGIWSPCQRGNGQFPTVCRSSKLACSPAKAAPAKSIIELQKNVAHVTGKDWMGCLPEPGPAFYLAAEDDADEIHIRLAAIAAHHQTTFRELIDGGLHVLCRLARTPCYARLDKTGKVEPTNLYQRLFEAAGDIKPKNISVDTLTRAFAGNEIDRVQVYAFAMHMQALAKVANGSVTVLSHPSLAGIAFGSGISGSTAWHGAFRFRQYLTGIKPTTRRTARQDLRELEFKNQYGPRGQSIVLRYQRGLFLPEGGMSSLDKLAREQRAEETFLTILARYERDGTQRVREGHGT